MAKPTGFIEYKRKDVAHHPVEQRRKNYAEVNIPHPEELMYEQAARCIDCGIPWCHSPYGCPVKNRIPEFNDLLYRGRWRDALENLQSTNNFPEFTGRVCPAPCESACTLNIGREPVLIEHIEYQIVEHGFKMGWVIPLPPRWETGKKIAVIGSGPSGLAAAQQLRRAGHTVTVFEKDERIGGLLRYGIPDFKLAKGVIDRRLEQMRLEGVMFQSGVKAGIDISARYLRKMFDVILLAMGAGVPRDLEVPGRELENVHFAMDFLTRQNRINSGEPVDSARAIDAHNKIVVVIGGGDTGSDCVGTANRQGAREVHQLEILPKPPEKTPPDTLWPKWQRILRTSTSQEEGCQRRWSVVTKKLTGTNGRVSALHGAEVEWHKGENGWQMREKPGTEFHMKVDLVLLAMGFVHVEHGGMIEQLGVELDQRGNVRVNNYATSVDGVFATGDTMSGASLVVRAINAGREAAQAINEYLAASRTTAHA